MIASARCFGWRSNEAVTLLYLETWRSTPTYILKTRFKTLWFSPLSRIALILQICLCFFYCFLHLWTFCQAFLLTCGITTKIWICCDFDPWHIIDILIVITPNFLPICLTIMAASAIFQALIWMGVGIGNLLIDLDVRNFLDTKITWSGNVLVSGWLSLCVSISLHYYCRLFAVMEWKVHILYVNYWDMIPFNTSHINSLMMAAL